MSQHATEVATGQRFEFGKNWAWFLETLNDQKIDEAVKSLSDMLQTDSLAGRSFLDIGSGSGLFSLAARKLGARVHSFDYDPNSVGCTEELRHRYFTDDEQWTVEPGSALDSAYIASLGKFDVVYSWGVLHHTGDMWTALANAAMPVASRGKLFIAIYNDQGTASIRWTKAKRLYQPVAQRSTNPRGLAVLLGVELAFAGERLSSPAALPLDSQLRQERARHVVLAGLDRLGGRLSFRGRNTGQEFRLLSRARFLADPFTDLRKMEQCQGLQ